MTKLYFETVINSEKEILFDISRDIDIHRKSLGKTKEKAIAGRKSGLIEEGEKVTWRGKHFGVNLTHESKITNMKKYDSFTDEMVNGAFKSFVHHHYFIKQHNYTLMIDEIYYETPYAILGRIFNILLLKKYLQHLIEERNTFLKKTAEKTKRLV